MWRILAIGFCIATSVACAQTTDPPNYFVPERFEPHIREFERADSSMGLTSGGVVFYGSSSIRFWHDSLAADMAHLDVVPRGFGGSTMIDAVTYADRVVIPHRPRAIVLYEGDNDIGAYQVRPARVAELFQTFVDTVHSRLPETEIYFLSIKPSPSRWEYWPQMSEANDLIRASCEGDPRLHYVDVATPMLGEDGTPNRKIFLDDMLHMNRDGYRIWKPILREALFH